jgi:hypothetical protein
MTRVWEWRLGHTPTHHVRPHTSTLCISKSAVVKRLAVLVHDCMDVQASVAGKLADSPHGCAAAWPVLTEPTRVLSLQDFMRVTLERALLALLLCPVEKTFQPVAFVGTQEQLVRVFGDEALVFGRRDAQAL